MSCSRPPLWTPPRVGKDTEGGKIEKGGWMFRLQNSNVILNNLTEPNLTNWMINWVRRVTDIEVYRFGYGNKVGLRDFS